MKYLFLFLLCTLQIEAQEIYKKSLSLMGSDFEITVVSENEAAANTAITLAINEISRIEKVISSWDKNSETSLVNNNAGIQPVKVSAELFALVQRSLFISKLTDGAFDISYASMDRIWKYDGSMTQMPSDEAIKISVAKVGYKNIILDTNNQTIFLKNKGMKIGFGAIGKGYAADKAKAILKEKGVSGGIINASGDMNTWGTMPDDSPWKVAITNPLNKKVAFGLLPIKGAVVTSGNYEKFVTFNGKRYSHIIDPRTGYPSSGILSVTVFAPKAELADALATSVFVMGAETGINRLQQLKGVECVIVLEDGSLKTSKNVQLERTN